MEIINLICFQLCCEQNSFDTCFGLEFKQKYHAYFKRWSCHWDAFLDDNNRDSNNGSNDMCVVNGYIFIWMNLCFFS